MTSLRDLIHDLSHWALPLFWLGIASAAFFTAQVLRVDDARMLIPIGVAALVLTCFNTCLAVLWRR